MASKVPDSETFPGKTLLVLGNPSSSNTIANVTRGRSLRFSLEASHQW